MPIGTPFHDRTKSLCHSHLWKDWGGYYTVKSYDTTHDSEYYAIRYSAALIDVSPLLKYDILGKDAESFLSFVMARDVSKLKDNQVGYGCWCDDQGKVIDDGTVTRVNQNLFRVTSAEPSFHWFHSLADGFDIEIKDVTDEFGALSVQGPKSRELLSSWAGSEVDRLKFFRSINKQVNQRDIVISRTGYTGDLGYEVWVRREDAAAVYDEILESGQPFRAMPCGLDAMDVSRVEAGFIMNGVDYHSANHVMSPRKRNSPYELGLGWSVHLDRDPFIGKDALIKEQKEGGPPYSWSTIEISWDSIESAFNKKNIPPEICTQAWRAPQPVFDEEGLQVGYMTSGAWSPILKKNLAVGFLKKANAAIGTQLLIDQMIEFERVRIEAKVVNAPAFNPKRKRSTPNG